MPKSTLENRKEGYGLEQPGQFFRSPQTYRELDGANWRESHTPRANPGIIMGTEDGRVPVPDALLNREPTPRTDDKWIFGGPEAELTRFRGQGEPPPLPDDPQAWGDQEWTVYFEWVASDPHQFQMLMEVYDALDLHYNRQM
jgi:hypothetical protein